MTAIIKAGIERPSIEGPGESSFPSGTAAWSMALVAAAILLAPPSRRLLLGALGALLLVALSGVIVWEEWHYPLRRAGGLVSGAGVHPGAMGRLWPAHVGGSRPV